MKEPRQVEYRGFSFGQVFIAALTGAAAGAAVAYFTAPAAGTESRRRIRAAVDETKNEVARVPEALRKATEAARDAFVETLAKNGANG
jgi:gas vesicle protein